MEREAALAIEHDAVRNRGQVSETFAGGTFVPELVSEIERIIGLLGKQRFLRLSLFRFQIDGMSATAVQTMMVRALKPQGIVGALPDGSIGFLYLGPRGKGMVADLALVHHIRERVRAEIHRQSPFNEMRLTSMQVTHRWADEVIDAFDLLDTMNLQVAAQSAKAS